MGFGPSYGYPRRRPRYHRPWFHHGYYHHRRPWHHWWYW